MNFRGLYKAAGVCAIGYALIVLAIYAISVSTNGFMAESTAPPSPDRILQLAQASGNRTAAQLDLLSYFLWVPALVGLFIYLRERRPGRAHLGGALAAFALIGFFAASAMNSATISLAQGPVTDALRDRLAVLSLLSFSWLLPAIYAINLSNLLWGLALRTQAGLAKIAGNLFLAQIVGFIIADGGFLARRDTIFNLGILISTLALVATYAAAGIVLVRASKGEAETVSPEQ